MALRFFLPRQPAGRAEGVFLALDKRSPAASAMLRRDSAKLGAFVAVFTEVASFDFIPIHTHQALPVGILADVIDALTEHRAERFEHL